MRFSYRWQVMRVIMLGLLMAVLDSTIVSVVLPQMATAFKAEYQIITWVATAYFLANAAVIPIVGYLSDRVGTKTIFVLALGLFTVGSALCVDDFLPLMRFDVHCLETLRLRVPTVLSSIDGPSCQKCPIRERCA